MAEFSRRPSTRAVLNLLLPIAIGTAGLLMVHHPMIFSRLDRIQTDPGDSRLINYFLEHSYRWFRSDPGHEVFWDPPFFYPARNVAAYSDVLLTVAPVYWVWRALGTPPDTAFQLWMIVTSGLNYLAGYILFRRGLRSGPMAASSAAFLVAFGAPRVNQIGHQQLLPCFYISIAVLAVIRIFSDRGLGKARSAALWLVASLAIVCQLYAGFYQGWFLILAMSLAAFGGLVLPSCRETFVRTLWRDAPAILVAAALARLAMQPFLTHYLRAAEEFGPGDISFVQMLIPTGWSWMNLGPHHWLWGWTAGFGPFLRLPWETEHRLGFGLVTPLACAVGLYVRRDWGMCRLAALVLLGLWLCVAYLPGDLLAYSAAVAASVCAAGLCHERDQPWYRVQALLGLLALFILARFPNPLVLTLELFTITLCVVEIGRERHHPYRSILPAIILFSLCAWLFSSTVLLIGIGLFSPLVLLAEYFRVPWRSEGRTLAIGALVVSLALLSFPHQPGALVAGLAGPPLLVALTSPRRLRPPARLQMWIVLIALPVIVFFFDRASLWDLIYSGIPGGYAIRAVGRVSLIMLFPLAIGLASLISTLQARRRTVLACAIGLLCMVEQGLSMPAFDKYSQRTRVAAIAVRVDPRCEAFYYHTRLDDQPPAMATYHLDAMWASLSRGIPTVNGYSGGWPPDWFPLRQVALADEPEVRVALMAWVRSRGLVAGRIQWFDHAGGPTRPGPFMGPDLIHLSGMVEKRQVMTHRALSR